MSDRDDLLVSPCCGKPVTVYGKGCWRCPCGKTMQFTPKLPRRPRLGPRGASGKAKEDGR
jgi:hypothetical protein